MNLVDERDLGDAFIFGGDRNDALGLRPEQGRLVQAIFGKTPGQTSRHGKGVLAEP